jgi:hypothetical protein
VPFVNQVRRAWSTPVLERTIDMAKFIYLYRGPATPMSDVTPEQGAERTAAFGAWIEKVGSALVDGGSPFGSSASVRDDGTEGTAGDLIGYTIVEADDLAAAKAFTDGLPFLSNWWPVLLPSTEVVISWACPIPSCRAGRSSPCQR